MDFELTPQQQAVREAARAVLAGQATPERAQEIESTPERFDRQLWKALADANLLGLAVPEAEGGSGLGMVEVCLLLEEHGRHVAPVPLWETVVLGALPIARFGTPGQRAAWLPAVVAGDVVLTAAAGPDGSATAAVEAHRDGSGWRLDGHVGGIPAAHVAERVLVPTRTPEGATVVALVDPRGTGTDLSTFETTDRGFHGRLDLDGAPVTEADVLAAEGGIEPGPWMVERALVGLCAAAVGIAEEALARTAAYVSERRQFGRPLSTFQGVAIRAADAFIDTEAMRVTMLQAAWLLDEGADARKEVLAAKWWAAEAGHRVVHAAQHLHGGVGVDVDYPQHRWFLKGIQTAAMLGGGSEHLERLGDLLAGGD